MAPKNKRRAPAVSSATEPETLRDNLGDALTELHQLLELAPDEATEEQLRRQRRIYFALWEEVIKRKIDQTTASYREAIEGLQAATNAARDAKADIEKLAAAIKQVDAAA